MEMLGAIVLVFALQKIAALLSIPVILGYDLGQGEGEQNGWRGVGAIFSTGQ